MSASTNPHHYSDLDDDYVTNANFKVDISQKMQVPNKISFNSEQQNGIHNWTENINMQVPDRILVVGQNQHMGTKAPPREIAFDNSLLPSDPFPSDPRVATPPRTLTLDRYPFPGINKYEEKEPERLPVAKTAKFSLHDNELNLSHRDMTPPMRSGDERISVDDEIQHLRQQMAKLNRRVMALELEHLNRLQKEKIIYGIGIAYFLLKTIIWLNRN